MTTDCEINNENATTQKKIIQLPAEIVDIIQNLSSNKDIVFKSLQIDDPDLPETEKKQIAEDIFIRNRSMFLLRFGSYFNERQLDAFESLIIQTPKHDDESLEEMKLVIGDLKQKLNSKKLFIKNRRYVALQDLIKKGEYFSEHEMMQRSPELYQELVGQYLSEAEKKIRDAYDVRNTTFSGILMHTLEQKERDKVVQKAMHIETDENFQTNVKQKDNVQMRPTDYEVPRSYRQQWGGFDDEQVACSTSINREKETIVKDKNCCINQKPSPSLITAGERELLRQEFTGLMYEQFLAGEDTDFDYSTVDDNIHLDDLKQYNQDQEDNYFERSDDSDEEQMHLKSGRKTQAMVEESEDELDLYMRHLQKHHSLQN